MNPLEIKTEYVKNKVKGLKFSRRNWQYIHDLTIIEAGVMGEIASISWARRFNEVIKLYQDGYLAIEEELNPGWRELERERLEKEKEQNLLRHQKAVAEGKTQKIKYEAEKNQWVSLDGKL